MLSCKCSQVLQNPTHLHCYIKDHSLSKYWCASLLHSPPLSKDLHEILSLLLPYFFPLLPLSTIMALKQQTIKMR